MGAKLRLEQVHTLVVGLPVCKQRIIRDRNADINLMITSEPMEWNKNSSFSANCDVLLVLLEFQSIDQYLLQIE